MFDRLVPPALADAALQHLQHDGVQRGAIVAWLGHNSWDMLATLVACERVGAVLLPLNWRLAAAELAQIVGHAGAGHLMGTPEVEALAAAVLAATPLTPGPAEGVQDDDLLLFYTSGTTGRPKGAMHTRAGVQANALAAVAAQRLDADCRVLSVLPLFHAGGLCIQTLPALAVGGRVLLHPRFEPDAWFDAVHSWRPTTSLLVPAVMRALTEHPRWARSDLSALAFVTSGSQIVPVALIEAFHARGVAVAQVYGCTESGPVSIVLRPDEAWSHVGQTGRPAPGVQTRLVDGHGRQVASGEVGEICLKAPNLMRGYHRLPAGSGFADGWFATGDLARADAQGFHTVVGRCSEMIISGGENIHPIEIETLAAGWPGVAEAVVVGLPDARWGEVPVLVLVAQPGAVVDLVALAAHFDSRLARFKHPRRTVLRADLPRTALGKVRRAQLAASLREAENPR